MGNRLSLGFGRWAPGRRSHDAGAGGSPGRGSRHVETLEMGLQSLCRVEFPSAPEALVERSRSGRGQVIDAAMVDGANYTVLSAVGRLGLAAHGSSKQALPLFKWMQSGLVPARDSGPTFHDGWLWVLCIALDGSFGELCNAGRIPIHMDASFLFCTPPANTACMNQFPLSDFNARKHQICTSLNKPEKQSKAK